MHVRTSPVHLLLFLVLPLSSAAVYVFPELVIQARSSGGVKVFLPDSCGVEGFGFQLKSPTDAGWRTGNGTKIGSAWVWEDKARTLKVGDQLDYSPRVWYRGGTYTLPIKRWIVPELVADYEAPQWNETSVNCSKSEEKLPVTSHTSNSTTSPPQAASTPLRPQPNQTQNELGSMLSKLREGSKRSKKLGSSTKQLKKDESKDNEDSDEKEDDKDEPPFSGPAFDLSCKWGEDEGPGDEPPSSREEALERQLSLLKCEMKSFLERTTRVAASLSAQLLDLKKLNYATVTRLQSLEALVRTIPRAVPFF